MPPFALSFGLGGLAALTVGALGLGVVRALLKRRHARRIRAGYAAESRAETVLVQHGYAVRDRQVAGHLNVAVDGRRSTVGLRSDLQVERSGQRWLVEVKSGDKGIEDSAVRRQLLEYAVAFDCERLLLVDRAGRRIREVQLFWKPSGRLRCALWAAAGFALAALLQPSTDLFRQLASWLAPG